LSKNRKITEKFAKLSEKADGMTEEKSEKFLIYGANGYTGELITRLAAERGLKPVLAGRNYGKVERLAKQFGMPFRIFSLDETAKID
jgi:short subunit dehydrogenase-like uncharacterized protein